MKLPDHSPPLPSTIPTPSLEEALEKNREVEGRLEICAVELAIFNETAKTEAAGHNVLQVERALAQNKSVEDRMLACAGDLHEVNEVLAQEIDDRDDRNRELTKTGKKLSDTQEILAVAERTTAEEKERLRTTLNHIADAVITTDICGKVTYLNPVAETMTGWASVEARGHPLQEVFKILHPQTEENTLNPIELILQNKTHGGLALHTVLIQRSGSTFYIEDSATPLRDPQGKIIGAVLIFHDVTQAREMAAQMTFQASHDALTGLIDRREFEKRLLLALLSGKQDSKQHTLLYLDIDHFKIVNDTGGHIAGDELLKKITSILQGQLRTNDTLARVGGDEFGLLLEGCPTQPALRVAELLRQSVQEFNFIWKEKVFHLGISIGLVTFGNGSETLPDILQMADAACYLAKDKGRNRVQIYTAEDARLAQRSGEMGWVGRIQKALNEERFVLYTQKISPLANNCDEGEHYEMLLRMQDEDGTLVPPMTFIPAAERYGLMPQLDRWVITTAFTQYERRHPPGKARGTCAINLSGASICDENFYEFVVAQLDRYKVPPDGVCFEITETSAIANLAQATVLVGRLKELGCRFSLDDFGSGMSSFAYLKHLPVDYLKIDGGFVKDMVDDPIDHAMVEAINHIGHVMHIKTIAEFVENDAILNALEKIGVDYAQGYGIEKPRLSELLLSDFKDLS
jgi:diguanylate cyclase (GGDEF)-like protein/PAS domain S-box-containing protein